MKRLQLFGFLLASAFFVLFLLVAREVKADGDLVRFDSELGLSLQDSRENTPALRVVFIALTQLASVETLLVLVPLAALLFWRRGQHTAAIVFLACGIGVGLLNYTTKKVFDRPRPEFKDRLVRESNESFPSGHSSGSMGVFGFLIFLLWQTKLDRRSRLLLSASLAVLIAATGFSRIYLGAHYFSDVIGGYLLGAAWLTLCILAMSLRRASALACSGERASEDACSAEEHGTAG